MGLKVKVGDGGADWVGSLVDDPLKRLNIPNDSNGKVATSSGLYLSPDKSTLINCDNHGKAQNNLDAIRAFQVPTPGDLSSITLPANELTDQSGDISTESIDPSDVTFNDEPFGTYGIGQLMYVTGKGEREVFVYYCSTPRDASTKQLLPAWSLDLSTTSIDQPSHIKIMKGGTEFHIADMINLTINVLEASTPGNPATATENIKKRKDVSGEFTNAGAAIRTFTYRQGGRKMYAAGKDTNAQYAYIVEYLLGTPEDPASADFVQKHYCAVNTIGDLIFNEDEQNVYVTQLTGGVIATMHDNT